MLNQAHRHATLTFERHCAAPVERVFAAYADVAERARLGTPSETAALIYDEADFRVGGRDIFRCGSKDDPRYLGETRYYDIVHNSRIISGETIDAAGARLSAALNTTTFEGDGSGTRILVVVQMISFDGDGMIAGTRMGTDAALDNLVDAMARRSLNDR